MSLSIANIPCSIYKTKVYNHLDIKDIILNEIREIGINSVNNDQEQIYNTDFFIKNNLQLLPRKNLNKVLLPVITNHNNTLSKKLNVKSIELDNYWYQQYKKNDFHKWHVHSFCVFSNIYYVNLDNQGSRTSFKHLDLEFNIDIEEGEILTFPSSFIHCSHPNQSDIMKTVISFNTNPIL